MNDSQQYMTLSSLSELNRSLRQQAVDLALSIEAMKERAGLLSGTNMQEATSGSLVATDLGYAFRSLDCAGPTKSRTRIVRGD